MSTTPPPSPDDANGAHPDDASRRTGDAAHSASTPGLEPADREALDGNAQDSGLAGEGAAGPVAPAEPPGPDAADPAVPAPPDGEDNAGAAEPPKKKTDVRMLRRLLALLVPYKGQVLVALLLTAAVAFLGPLQPKLVQIAIDEHVVQGDYGGLQRIVVFLFLALAGEAVLSFALNYLTQVIGQSALLDIRTRVFRHITRQRLAFFDRTPLGTLITRTTSDVEALETLLSAGVVTMLGDILKLIFIGAFMFALDPELAMVALCTLPLMVWATMEFRRRVREVYRETRKQVARLNAFIQEHVTGMKVVQLFNREREEARRFAGINDEHRQAQIKTIFYFALFYPAVEIISALALGLVLWYGGGQAIQGSVSLGVLIAFVQYVRQFFQPVRNLSDQFNTLQGAFAAGERVFGVLDDDRSIPDAAEPKTLQECCGTIEFRNVWFAYGRQDAEAWEGEGEPPWDWVLRDVSFTAKQGETIALVGATGSGKSTTISLLLRFYEPQRGQILVDGVDIRELPVHELRRHIGLVLQDVFLFSGSIADNVTLHDPTKSLADVEEAARLVGADRFIDRLPGGFGYDVRERGQTLSHGQRQLVSFIRALVYDPAILVLDEATSSVDSETEEAVQHALDVLMEGRTSLVVAHRLSTIQHAAQILVLHKGVVRERGTHQALLAQEGLYRKLYELQYAEQEGRRRKRLRLSSNEIDLPGFKNLAGLRCCERLGKASACGASRHRHHRRRRGFGRRRHSGCRRRPRLSSSWTAASPPRCAARQSRRRRGGRAARPCGARSW